jgi:hypothetical protein
MPNAPPTFLDSITHELIDDFDVDLSGLGVVNVETLRPFRDAIDKLGPLLATVH